MSPPKELGNNDIVELQAGLSGQKYPQGSPDGSSIVIVLALDRSGVLGRIESAISQHMGSLFDQICVQGPVFFCTDSIADRVAKDWVESR